MQNLGDLFNNVASIIEQAAKTRLGITALVILVLGVLGAIFFKDGSPMKVRVAMYIFIFLGISTFAFVMTTQGPTPQPPGTTPENPAATLPTKGTTTSSDETKGRSDQSGRLTETSTHSGDAEPTSSSTAALPMIKVKIDSADDRAFIVFNGEVTVEGNATDWVVVPEEKLRSGENPLAIRVFNQESYTGGVPLLGGHQPEGWNYTVRVQIGTTEYPPFSDREDRPSDAHFGKTFTAKELVITVDRTTGRVALR